MDTTLGNLPVWPTLTAEMQRGFQEVWYLKLNDPASQRALWLRFTLLSSSNGFKRLAETWAIAFQRGENRETSKVALKQSHDIKTFVPQPNGVRIGDSELGDGFTRGSIQSKGRAIKWDLKFAPERAASFNFVPENLARAGIVKNKVATVNEDLRFSGTAEVDGVKWTITAAPGMQGHLSGPRNGHSWVWGHCNSFVTEQGQAAHFVFEGLSARARLAGVIPSPKMSAYFFLYQDQEFRFNTIWDTLRARSENSLTEWTFQADRGDFSFRGVARAEHRDFAGITYEDTDGSLLYCANSKLSDMTVLVYRRGKLEQTLLAKGTAAFEVVSRHRNPYVPLMI